MTDISCPNDIKRETVTLEKTGLTGVWHFGRFTVAFRDLSDERVMTQECQVGSGLCRMVSCLSGNLNILMGHDDRDEKVVVSEGSCSLHYHPTRCRCSKCDLSQRALVLELICPAREFMQLAGRTRLSEELAEAVKEGEPFHIHQSMSPAIHDALVTLRNSMESDGEGDAPLVLSKVLELIWLFVKSRAPRKKETIAPLIRKSIEKAGGILERRMAEPPTLEDLAAKVGMSLSKLKQTFPQVYGMPPYAYLRKVRMEKAKNLLVHHRVSVTEAALEVGYSNLSHFSKAFTEHHGIKPSQVL